jgi:hypothetical protein
MDWAAQVLRKLPTVRIDFHGLGGSEAAPNGPLDALPIPRCAREIFANCTIERLPATWPENGSLTGRRLLAVDMAYVMHYRGNLRRLKFQREQLPKLGVPVSFVTGYDREDVDGHNRACLLTTSRSQDARVNMHELDLAYTSQVIKLLAALYDMLRARHTVVLTLEDDAVIQLPNVRLLDEAAASLRGEFSIIFSGSYSTSGKDSLIDGFYLKDRTHVPDYRGDGRMMPAVGCVVTAAGARHMLSRAYPIRGPIDVFMSDAQVPSSPKRDVWVFKPYAFVPGAFGEVGRFGGEGIASLKKALAAHSHDLDHELVVDHDSTLASREAVNGSAAADGGKASRRRPREPTPVHTHQHGTHVQHRDKG